MIAQNSSLATLYNWWRTRDTFSYYCKQLMEFLALVNAKILGALWS